jgi:CheY-like chemotaxis protein
VLTDYNLRGMSGVAMIEALRAQGVTNLISVLFTAYDDPTVRREARRAGITRFIAKPFMIEEFVDMARGLLPINASEMGSPPA